MSLMPMCRHDLTVFALSIISGPVSAANEVDIPRLVIVLRLNKCLYALLHSTYPFLVFIVAYRVCEASAI